MEESVVVEESEAEDLSLNNVEAASTSRKMSPIVSHNEVSSSKQEDLSRSSTPDTSLVDQSSRSMSSYSWHHPTLTLAPTDLPPAAPVLSTSSVVPLLLPYHPLSHSLVYMNPFLPSPCHSSLMEKKKRNRTFIDPVSEVEMFYFI